MDAGNISRAMDGIVLGEQIAAPIVEAVHATLDSFGFSAG